MVTETNDVIMQYGDVAVASVGYVPNVVGNVLILPREGEHDVNRTLAVELIDLPTAEKILDRLVRQKHKKFNFQPTQRRLNKRHAARIKRTIDKGYFRFTNGIPFVTFDKNGYVVDGGHRMLAIRDHLLEHPHEAIEVLVCRNVTAADAGSLDRGKIRTMNQVRKYYQDNPSQGDVLKSVGNMFVLRPPSQQLLVEEERELFRHHGDDIEEGLTMLAKRKNLKANPVSNYGISGPIAGGLLRAHLHACKAGKRELSLAVFDALKTERAANPLFSAEQTTLIIEFQRFLGHGAVGTPRDRYRKAENFMYSILNGQTAQRPAGELFPFETID